VRLTPIIYGGGHERGMRSGTLNVPGIVGFGKAAELCRVSMADEGQRILRLRERLRDGIWSRLDEVYLNGHPTHRLPGNLNVSFAYVEGESLLMGLNGSVHADRGRGVAAADRRFVRLGLHVGHPGAVLRAEGARVGDDLAHTSIRFGLAASPPRRKSTTCWSGSCTR